jgi:uncharacterized integral membrane protein
VRGAPPAGGSLISKIVAALILVPLGIVLVALAVANRQPITISLDPLAADHLASFATPPLPLFVVLFVVLIVGVVIGGFASWLRHGGWRRTARRLQRDLRELRAELDALKQRREAEHLRPGNVPPGHVPPRPMPSAAQPPERLKLKAPLR